MILSYVRALQTEASNDKTGSFLKSDQPKWRFTLLSVYQLHVIPTMFKWMLAELARQTLKLDVEIYSLFWETVKQLQYLKSVSGLWQQVHLYKKQLNWRWCYIKIWLLLKGLELQWRKKWHPQTSHCRLTRLASAVYTVINTNKSSAYKKWLEMIWIISLPKRTHTRSGKHLYLYFNSIM